MRIIAWIGNDPNQRALINKIHAKFPLAGIVTETRTKSSKLTFDKIRERLFLPQPGNAWRNLQERYAAQFPVYPRVVMLNVESVNSDQVMEFSKDADLIIVSGTRLINDRMLSLKRRIGILNLHTGLSPYVKGGPNCTNWCIANAEFHLIGNTVMWIDSGIDSGNILTTEFTELNGEEDLETIHWKVMEHAHELYIKAIGSVIQGNRQSIPQETIAKGRTYYTKDWTYTKKAELVVNMNKIKNAVVSGDLAKRRENIRTISL